MRSGATWKVMRQSRLVFLHRGDGGDAVDVALHEMSADVGIGAERKFEVDAVLAFLDAEGRAVEGFRNDVELEIAVGDFDDGEADAGDADGVAELDFGISEFRE